MQGAKHDTFSDPAPVHSEARMLKHVVAALFITITAPALAQIQVDVVPPPLDPELIAPARVRPAAAMPMDQFAVDHASLRDPARQRALMAAIADWLTREFNLPRASELPKIAFVSPSELLRKRYRVIRADATRATYDMPAPAAIARTVAIYEDSEKTIYLTEDWRGDSAADISVVVHELVHHLQNIAQMRFECTRAREATAYEAQERWLQQHGRSLRADFDIDPFTVLVHAMCL
jgi:hypothetical protein